MNDEKWTFVSNVTSEEATSLQQQWKAAGITDMKIGDPIPPSENAPLQRHGVYKKDISAQTNDL